MSNPAGAEDDLPKTQEPRTGNVVRSGRFMQTRVVAIVEHPALEDEAAKAKARSRRRVSDDQSPLL